MPSPWACFTLTDSVVQDGSLVITVCSHLLHFPISCDLCLSSWEFVLFKTGCSVTGSVSFLPEESIEIFEEVLQTNTNQAECHRSLGHAYRYVASWIGQTDRSTNRQIDRQTKIYQRATEWEKLGIKYEIYIYSLNDRCLKNSKEINHGNRLKDFFAHIWNLGFKGSTCVE